MPKENDILETTLSLAESSYPEAYRYLLDAYQANSKAFGPQTFYFLPVWQAEPACRSKPLAWLRSAITDHAWMYRPEVLTDDDLAAAKGSPGVSRVKVPFRSALCRCWFPGLKRCSPGKGSMPTACSWPFMATPKMGRPRGRTGNPYWAKAIHGSWKQSKAPSPTDTAPIAGAMTALPMRR